MLYKNRICYLRDIPLPYVGRASAGGKWDEPDIRCHPLHAMKMAARLQAANTSENPILLEIRKAAGHESDITRKVWSTRKADGWIFLMHHLGMSNF